MKNCNGRKCKKCKGVSCPNFNSGANGANGNLNDDDDDDYYYEGALHATKIIYYYDDPRNMKITNTLDKMSAKLIAIAVILTLILLIAGGSL